MLAYANTSYRSALLLPAVWQQQRDQGKHPITCNIIQLIERKSPPLRKDSQGARVCVCVFYYLITTPLEQQQLLVMVLCITSKSM